MNDETYNGWTNRETWGLDLWLSNDQGLYEMTLERVRDALAGYEMPDWVTAPAQEEVLRARVAGDAIRELWEELTDPNEELLSAETLTSALKDVGSEWRIDWEELGRHWAEAVAEEEEEAVAREQFATNLSALHRASA